MTQTQLIALDWGTSSLRAYRLGPDGAVLEQRQLATGIMHLPPVSSADQAALGDKAGFEIALKQACGDWLMAAPEIPQIPIIACGMIGSMQGWSEAPYLPTPIAINQIGNTLTTVQTSDKLIIHIVPGLIQHSELPNVMRGEETQVIGALSIATERQRKSGKRQVDEVLIGLPGTHSKWIRVHQHSTVPTIQQFDTFMTGEVYAALCAHTILGRTMQAAISAPSDDDHAGNAAFLRGLDVAQTVAGRAGVLSTIFSTRTLGLTGVLDGTGQREYLSGLLIGHEIAVLRASLEQLIQRPQQIILIGDNALCARYKQALEVYEINDAAVMSQATERGLWMLAEHAGLVSANRS
ncbi:2-dehydro-3-deoxygalactonokinase [Glaciimonas immobilis]|uniref:2-dehydro-3-deoxygalactonokinase n=1 Tax=Glaciimonas immobilis TaxID=728004 RepID=A0A840RSY4_9BURK|nr:2-dehydro-3-deoxygalactonokinase [Glaciimonas immobilis]KAF3999632.1 2-dehydro-3-deoxygalactonokinase [Glaciimonas immobilis]MBB5200066.1 2-dehydro-3-deoxygalactonokinase [Glaciimonas immobilis]